MFDVNIFCQSLLAIVHPLPSLLKANYFSSIETSANKEDVAEVDGKKGMLKPTKVCSKGRWSASLQVVSP